MLPTTCLSVYPPISQSIHLSIILFVGSHWSGYPSSMANRGWFLQYWYVRYICCLPAFPHLSSSNSCRHCHCNQCTHYQHPTNPCRYCSDQSVWVICGWSIQGWRVGEGGAWTGAWCCIQRECRSSHWLVTVLICSPFVLWIFAVILTIHTQNIFFVVLHILYDVSSSECWAFHQSHLLSHLNT